jgi:hypothetical protein
MHKKLGSIYFKETTMKLRGYMNIPINCYIAVI